MSRAPWLAAGVVVVAAAAGTAVFVTRDDTGAAGSDVPTKALSTTEVVQQDVTTMSEASATLEFTTSVTVSSPVAGTVTSIVGQGDAITAGTVTATLDGDPLVALFGDVPAWRDLSTDSSDGVDVFQLEQNLVLLGYDPDGEIVIDETFDDATEAAVERWETALGLDTTGEVPEARIVFVPGELSVDSVAVDVGGAASSGGALVTARQTRRAFLVSNGGDDFISNAATAGQPVVSGTVLYRSDYLPVVAIEGDSSSIPTLSRDLSVGADDGRDVRLLEQMLSAGGFTADGALVVDDEFDLATATAVLAWWQSVDPAIQVDPADLVVPAGSYVVVPSGLETADLLVGDRTTTGGDTVVAELTAPARRVTTTAPVGDDTFALGAEIDVEFPDGTVASGVVDDVGTSATSSGVGQTPTVSIGIRVDDIPASVDQFVSIPVTLKVIDQQIPDAFLVPTSALLALAEGGYALQVVDGTAADGTQVTHLIPVETGIFTEGYVVVSGDELSDGLEVVVPS
ncbi:MAG: peptidoglycan-binding domain-containing protein [Acidimicrobiales bacterium]